MANREKVISVNHSPPHGTHTKVCFKDCDFGPGTHRIFSARGEWNVLCRDQLACSVSCLVYYMMLPWQL